MKSHTAGIIKQKYSVHLALFNSIIRRNARAPLLFIYCYLYAIMNSSTNCIWKQKDAIVYLC